MFPETLAGVLLLGALFCYARGGRFAASWETHFWSSASDDAASRCGDSGGDSCAGRARLAQTPLCEPRHPRFRVACAASLEPVGLGSWMQPNHNPYSRNSLAVTPEGALRFFLGTISGSFFSAR